MRRGELTHERQKTNVAETFASRIWLPRTAKNFHRLGQKSGFFNTIGSKLPLAACCAKVGNGPDEPKP
jgi:hypothetical protein